MALLQLDRQGKCLDKGSNNETDHTGNDGRNTAEGGGAVARVARRRGRRGSTVRGRRGGRRLTTSGGTTARRAGRRAALRRRRATLRRRRRLATLRRRRRRATLRRRLRAAVTARRLRAARAAASSSTTGAAAAAAATAAATQAVRRAIANGANRGRGLALTSAVTHLDGELLAGRDLHLPAVDLSVAGLGKAHDRLASVARLGDGGVVRRLTTLPGELERLALNGLRRSGHSELLALGNDRGSRDKSNSRSSLSEHCVGSKVGRGVVPTARNLSDARAVPPGHSAASASALRHLECPLYQNAATQTT